MSKRILALVSEPISHEALASAIGDDARGAEVMVVAPALTSRTRLLMSDVDGSIERAEQVAQESVERLEEAGISASGDTGEPEPLLALEDALATFPADEVVLFTHPSGSRNWQEEGVVEEAEQRFDIPVRHLLVDPPD
jgi:nucleotide-binding universal stress UspA family protein